MSTPMTSLDLGVLMAVRDAILGSAVSLPKAPLVAQASVGATTISVSPTLASQFQVGGLIAFDDDLEMSATPAGLPWCPIAAVNTTTGVITLDVAGMASLGFPVGLAATHPAGTTVYSNLIMLTPWDLTMMLQGGKPVIFLTNRSSVASVYAPRKIYSAHHIHIQYHRLIQRDIQIDGTTVDPNLWSLLQEYQARVDMETINVALLKNTHLVSGRRSPAANKLGRPDDGNGWSTLQFDRRQVDADSWHFIAVLSLPVTDVGTLLV